MHLNLDRLPSIPITNIAETRRVNFINVIYFHNTVSIEQKVVGVTCKYFPVTKKTEVGYQMVSVSNTKHASRAFIFAIGHEDRVIKFVL